MINKKAYTFQLGILLDIRPIENTESKTSFFEFRPNDNGCIEKVMNTDHYSKEYKEGFKKLIYEV